MLRFIVLLALSIFFVGCSSRLIVQSDPPEAEVFLSAPGRKEPVRAGKTPFELTETEIRNLLQLDPGSSGWVEVTFVKKDSEKKTVFVPSNRWGEMSKTIRVQLKPSEDDSTVVTRLVRHLFNSKKFAETRQYDQAHNEIDKVLAIDSKMAQAMTMKGGIFFLQGDLNSAEEWYKKAIAVDPSMSEAVQMLERIKSQKGGGGQ